MLSDRSFVLSLLLVAIVVAPNQTPAAAARPTDEKTTYDDGSLHYRVPLDNKGQRHGEYVAYFPGGKKKIEERVRYEHGDRHGVREVYDQTGRLTGEEV